jgi:Leucine-rich repeat (LRR) protein
MKQLLLICAVVMGQSVLAADKKPLIADPIVEKEIRRVLEKPEGELTKADLEKVADLYLGDTKITDAGLKDVAKMKQLERLTLIRTGITDASLKEVAKLQNLTKLNLYDTQITDAGLKEVAKLLDLTYLDLTRTKVTAENAAELQKALPKCRIRH